MHCVISVSLSFIFSLLTEERYIQKLTTCTLAFAIASVAEGMLCLTISGSPDVRARSRLSSLYSWAQGRSQEFAKGGGQTRRSRGRKSPSAGAEPRVLQGTATSHVIM